LSKEIAQTVGGKRIAWLLAIVAAFAVFATVSLQSDTARADATIRCGTVDGNPPTGAFATVPAGDTIYCDALTPAAATGGVSWTVTTVTGTASATITNGSLLATVGTAPADTAEFVVSGSGTFTISVAYNDANGSHSAAETGQTTSAITVQAVTGSANTVAAGQAATVTFTIPAGLTYCSDGTGGDARAFTAPDQTVSGLTVQTTTPTTAADTGAGTHTVTVLDDATPGGTVAISTHLSGAAAGAGCTSTTVTLTSANFAIPELRHIADANNAEGTNAIGQQEVNNNVRGSRHTICTVAQNTAIDSDDDGLFNDGGSNVAPQAVQIPGITLANIVITNGGGYQSTADTDPTFTDVRIFTGTGDSNDVTEGLSGATCISWVSTDAGDQQINIVYVGLNGVQYNASWDSDANGNGTTAQSNRSLIKEWNRLEDSELTISGVSQGSAQNVTITRSVVLNPATGQYQFASGPITISDVFQGSHTNNAGVNEGQVNLAGVNWTYAISSCGGGGNGSGSTFLNTDGDAEGGPSVVINPVNCLPGQSIVVTFTGTEPGPLGSGSGITVTETVTINLVQDIAEKKVFLAWAGQRVILEHDWRLPAGDVDGGSDDNDPDYLGACAFQDVNFETGRVAVTYIKGSGPGNFLPTGSQFDLNGSDQIWVYMDHSDSDQTDGSDIIGDPNGMCISRALFESEDQGQVDIEAFIDESEFPTLNSTKVAFVIYYMKINTINVSLVTQVSKPSHNSSAIADYSPGNPWNASLDDADNAADWNVSRDLLVRGRVTGWFLTTNPSGRAADTSNPLNVLPANRWVMPQDWPLLAGGPADPADGTDAVGTAEQFRPYYDIMFAPNNTRGIALTTPEGAAASQVATVATVAGITNSATAFAVTSCADIPAGASIIVGTTATTATSCVGVLLTATVAATPAAGTPVFLVTGVPFEGPYSTVDIIGFAAEGLGGAALSDWDPNNIRDTTKDDGDVDMWDAPMPPAPASVAIRGTGFIKQVLKHDVYYLGAASASDSEAAQTFPNPYYIQDIPASPFIPAVVAGGGYHWNTWGNDGPGGAGQGVYRFWVPAVIGANSEGIGDSFTAAQAAELAAIRVAYSNDNTIARDLVVYTDNHGEFMVTANGDFRTDLTACATNVLAGGKHCKPGDKVGTGTITATVDYPDFRGKHFPVLSNAATVTWTWGGYKDVTVEDGETDQFKYIVFHAMDRDGFCSPLSTVAVLLHPVLSSEDAKNTIGSNDPVENVDFLIDSGEGIIIGQSGGGTINDGKQFATDVTTFSVAVNNPASTGILEFPLSPLAAAGQTDECQAWIKVSNSLLGILNVLAIAADDEGNIGFDEIIDLTNTMSYTLNFRWSLITWAGADGISVNDAIKGTGTSGDNPGGNDISASVTAIYGWDAAAQQWLGYFPSGVNVPGANDLVSLETGEAYWIAITGPSSVTWTIATNVN